MNPSGTRPNRPRTDSTGCISDSSTTLCWHPMTKKSGALRYPCRVTGSVSTKVINPAVPITVSEQNITEPNSTTCRARARNGLQPSARVGGHLVIPVRLTTNGNGSSSALRITEGLFGMLIFKRRGHESTGHLEKSIRDFIELRIWKNAKACSWTASTERLVAARQRGRHLARTNRRNEEPTHQPNIIR